MQDISHQPLGRHAQASSVQQAMWYLDQVYPGAGKVFRVYLVRGPLDLDRLRRAWREVVTHHEALRTTCFQQHGGVTQRITPANDIANTFSFVDLTMLSAMEAELRARTTCTEWTNQSVSVSVGPVAQLLVIRTDQDQHWLTLRTHQLAADADSINILMQDLSVHYSEPGADVPHHAQYVDFAEQQYRLRGTDMFGQSLAWWSIQFTPPPTVADLPADRDPSTPDWRTAAESFDWGPDAAASISAFAEATGKSPTVIILTAFQVLMSRYSGETRITTGLISRERPLEFSRAVGPFTTVLPLCVDLSGETTFRDAVNRTDHIHQSAIQHRHVQLPDIVQAVSPPRDPGRSPLYRTTFTIAVDESPPEFPNATTQTVHANDGPVWADLGLSVHIGATITGRLDYRGDLFESRSARAILDHLRTVLIAGLNKPGEFISGLPLEMPQHEQSALRTSDRISGGVATEPVHDAVLRHATGSPAITAISANGVDTTYRQLRKQALRILTAMGLPRDSRVALRLRPGADQVAAMLGVFTSGGHIVLLDTDDHSERSKEALLAARPTALICHGDDGLATWYAQTLGGLVIDVSQLDTASRREEPLPVQLTDLAYVAFTSGSTGAPKGIPQTHRTLAQFANWFHQEFAIGPGSRVAQWASPAYDASICEIFATLVAGATLCPVPKRARANPDELTTWLTEERITHLQTVPSFARELLRPMSGTRTSLTHLLLAGEALSPHLANEIITTLPQVRLVNLYGPTETILATWHPVTSPVHTAVPIGRSIPGRHVLIVDSQDNPCPAGVTGEIVVRGPHVTPGYLGDDHKVTRPFQPWRAQPCYRTGDLGRRRWDGALEFRGRRDHQVKLQGRRLEIDEIESRLGSLETVAECVVLPVRDDTGLVNRLVAVIAPKRDLTGRPLGSAQLWRSQLRQWFGPSTLALSVKSVPRLPRNAGGKVDRQALLGLTHSAVEPVNGQPRTATEQALAEIWSVLLGASSIRRDDDFFLLGGHSVLILALLAEVERWFKVRLSPTRCLADTSLAGMASSIDHGSAADAAGSHRQQQVS